MRRRPWYAIVSVTVAFHCPGSSRFNQALDVACDAMRCLCLAECHMCVYRDTREYVYVRFVRRLGLRL